MTADRNTGWKLLGSLNSKPTSRMMHSSSATGTTYCCYQFRCDSRVRNVLSLKCPHPCLTGCPLSGAVERAWDDFRHQGGVGYRSTPRHERTGEHNSGPAILMLLLYVPPAIFYDYSHLSSISERHEEANAHKDSRPKHLAQEAVASKCLCMLRRNAYLYSFSTRGYGQHIQPLYSSSSATFEVLALQQGCVSLTGSFRSQSLKHQVTCCGYSKPKPCR